VGYSLPTSLHLILAVSVIMYSEVCKLSDLREEELNRFDIGDLALLVVKFDDKVFVTNSICTHEEADLSLGMFNEGVVTCPLHRARFRIDDGQVLSGPDEGIPGEIATLKTYKSKIEDGRVLAELG
jgi:3-phenylpropionate/trans-cinnamate dioxygenase ferredoxin component